MLVAERYEKIVGLVNDRGSIRVSELSELCHVTEETIRRDLDRLEKSGRLRRSHGGAVHIKEHHPETPYGEREIMHAEEKRSIAKEAVKRIQPNDRILLDASTTAWYMAANLPDIPLTVLTNSIKVVLELSGKEKIQVISTGGLLSQRSLSFVGPLAERTLETYHVDKCFFSCKGVHLERGVSESNELQAQVKQRMIGIADQVFLLADSSKFGLQSFTHVSELNGVSEIITDHHLDQLIQQQLQERSIKVTMV
ncbi:DeoR/GlpR family DNA-binding transcription regulator [Paenibacillus crassostreae]|uniref:DeoR family transcriptional regulator n=1 Tax=Paenibacillus crassostreae TaxID=1763538 RepID=A0A167FU10_9BACL|nr:DeoR/GlpR family DNA-binding transcription regulator [Paenibacillus crassostreae]AOZ94065.1 DeoR family transcriptional regulator [Paenibacillus crassostreae]OAB76899.1 DeoR family transcriptional regulator [Paenibacillus crassostreae]